MRLVFECSVLAVVLVLGFVGLKALLKNLQLLVFELEFVRVLLQLLALLLEPEMVLQVLFEPASGMMLLWLLLMVLGLH